jgi:hypothetical protein
MPSWRSTDANPQAKGEQMTDQIKPDAKTKAEEKKAPQKSRHPGQKLRRGDQGRKWLLRTFKLIPIRTGVFGEGLRRFSCPLFESKLFHLKSIVVGPLAYLMMDAAHPATDSAAVHWH